MPIELITERNMSAGLHVPIVYINDITGGLFVNFLLFIIWVAVTMGIFFIQKRSLGVGDFPMALAVGGFVTGVTTILLNLIEGLVNPYSYAIVMVMALFSILFFLFSTREGY